MTALSERIKSLIEKFGLSYKELEKITGISKSSLQRYASGTTAKIPLDVIEKLSKSFNVSQEYLIGLSIQESDFMKKEENLSSVKPEHINETKMKFNEKLTILRKERRMNMTEFANLLGTSKQVIARYERGENTPKITTVAHYAKVLGVSLQYLINEDCTDRTGNTQTNSKVNSPEEPKLSEDENMLLDLFRRVPEDKHQLVLQMLRVALENQE